MKKVPDLQEIPKLPEEIIQAGLNGDLVLFVGAGISKLVGLPSWGELAFAVLEQLRNFQLLNYSELDHLSQLDPKKQLSIAKLIASENDCKLDLIAPFQGQAEGNTIYRSINDIGCTCVTTNYDELLCPSFIETKDGSTTPHPVKRFFEKKDFFSSKLNEPGTVLHLHGSISEPKQMVLTTEDYLLHYDDENVKHFLKELFSKKTVFFIGYGLEETELLEHIVRRGQMKPRSERRWFTLQGFFQSQKPLYENLHHYYLNSFGIHLIGFIRDYENYNQQERIFKDWAGQIEVRKPALADDIACMNEVLGNV